VLDPGDAKSFRIECTPKTEAVVCGARSVRIVASSELDLVDVTLTLEFPTR
jgi:hypothetical protein